MLLQCALRGSLQDVHRALAEKEEALQRLARSMPSF